MSAAQEIDKIIADYLIAVETGEEADLDTLCDQHPEHADGIREYFAVRANVLHAIGADDSASAIQIEGYDILREIGRGAMGVVFEAIQQNLHRQVAIKVLKEGALGSAATKKRFEDEARLIAQLDHEHVVGVIDYGVVSGQPYMVMPMVHGRSLNKVIQKGPLSHRNVANLMLQATSAIAAAHEQGIVHRDIKPANILVDLDLTSCQISDFGLAAWNEQTQRLTQTGDIVGTAGYIAPEVIRGKSKGDVKSDIYSTGATIYALLTGVSPFRAATPAESIMLAMSTDPVKPRNLNPGIPVDIESICLKCMHPTPERRYTSIQDVHADLQRFVDRKPVAARPVSSRESLVRWAKRNRSLAGALAATGLLLFGLLTAISVSLAGYYRYSNELTGLNTELNQTNDDLKTAKQRAEEQRDLARRIQEYTADIFKAPAPISSGKDVRVVDVLPDAVQQLDAEHPDDSEFKAAMLVVFANAYRDLSEHQEAEELYSRALEITKRLQLTDELTEKRYRLRRAENLIELGSTKIPQAIGELQNILSTTETSADERRQIYTTLAYAHYLIKDKEGSQKYGQLAIEGFDFENGEFDGNISGLLTYIMSLHNVDPQEAQKLYLKFQDQFEDEELKPIWRVLFHLNYGTLLLEQLGKYDQAAELLRLAVDEGQTHLGPDDTRVVSAKGSLGSALVRLERASEAVPLLESAFETKIKRYGEKSPITWKTMRILAAAYGQSGESEKAVSMLQRFVKVAEEMGDTSSEDYISLLHELGSSLNEIGRVQESLPIWQKITKYCEEHYEPEAERTLISKNNLATALKQLGRFNESVEIGEQVVEGMKRTLTTSHARTRSAMQNLAVSYWAAGNRENALKLIAEVIEIRQQHDGPESRTTIGAIQEKSVYLRGIGKADQALSELQALQRILESKFDASDPRTLWNQVRIAEAFAAKGSVEEALELLQSILDRFSITKGAGHQETLHVEGLIGSYLHQLDRLEEGEAVFKQVIPKLIAQQGEDSAQVLGVRSELASVYIKRENYEQAEKILNQVLETGLKQGDGTSVLGLRVRLATVLNKQRKYARADRQFQIIIDGYRQRKNLDYVLIVSLGRSVNLIEAKNAELAEQVLLESQSLAKPGSFNDLRGRLLLAIARYMKSPSNEHTSAIRAAFKALEKQQSKFLIQHKRRFEQDKKRLLEILEYESVEELETWLQAD